MHNSMEQWLNQRAAVKRRLSLLLMLFVSVNVGCAEFSDDVTDMGIAVDAAVSVQRISDLAVDDASVDAGMSVDADVSLPDAEVVCDQPGRVGLCMFCDTNGNVFQPETDQDCPELTCLSLVEFDRVDDTFASACVRTQSPQPARSCG